jgi:hypothetical protein
MHFEPEYLLAVAARLTSHREELVTAIRNRHGMDRDLARLLGDTAGAARMQAIIERDAKVVSDRARATAMFVASLSAL